MSDVVDLGNGKYSGKRSKADGSVYNGELKKSAAMGYIGHGKGRWTHPDGDSYDGDWKDGKKDGRGAYKFADGSSYEGEFKDNQREGRGVFKWSDGRVYDGEWVAGKKEGRGKFTSADGEVTLGTWKNDVQAV